MVVVVVTVVVVTVARALAEAIVVLVSVVVAVLVRSWYSMRFAGHSLLTSASLHFRAQMQPNLLAP